MEKGLLSVLIPLYNEEQYIGTLLQRVLDVDLPGGLRREIVVVDDCSKDSSPAIVERFAERYPNVVRLIRSEVNGGKGAAIHKAIDAARGEFSVIQDADLEYDPRDYRRLLPPLLDDRADAVFGSRFLTSEERRVLYFWHSVANQLLTLACNIVSDLNLTDMETCYKVVRTPLLQSIPLDNKRFGFEPELTIKLAHRQARIYEVPISYNGRTYEEGKKIGLKDAFEALYTILRYAFTDNLYRDPGQQILDLFARAAPNFNRWMADTVRPYLGSEVLEVGAGMGNITRLLAPRRKRYVATDANTEYLHRIRTKMTHVTNLEVHETPAECEHGFSRFREQMDSVVCLNVIEHIKDDAAALRNMYSVLKPGGSAVILVPQDPSLLGTLDASLGHQRRYTRTELQSKMESAGFTVEKMIGFNRPARFGWTVTGKILKQPTISPWQLRLYDRLVWLWRRTESALPWDPVSLIAVGRR